MAGEDTYSDQELVAQLKVGNRAAFTQIYDRYNGLLYLFAYKRLQNREDAKDLIHELFMKLWTDHDRLNIAGNLPAYLYTALRNKIINLIAHKKTSDRYIDSFQSYLENLSINNADHLIRANELQAFIEREVAKLQPRTKIVFELSRKTNLTRKEIARELGISEETVKSHMHTALKVLKSRLGPFLFALFY